MVYFRHGNSQSVQNYSIIYKKYYYLHYYYFFPFVSAMLTVEVLKNQVATMHCEFRKLFYGLTLSHFFVRSPRSASYSCTGIVKFSLCAVSVLTFMNASIDLNDMNRF